MYIDSHSYSLDLLLFCIKSSELIKQTGIKNYKEFVDMLSLGLHSFQTKPKIEWVDKAIKYVDGFAADELRRLVDIETRRKDGVFFTNSKLAMKVFQLLKPDFNKQSVIYDPACGVGNLIISTYNFIQENKIRLNNKEHLLGTDIHQEFIEAARLRCLINQLLYPVSTSSTSKVITSIFSFSQADGLKSNEYYDKATHIIVNPPFNLVCTTENLAWSHGKVSSAALFIDKIVQNINPGTSIYAILPDVLRSGSRYEKWRQMVQQNCTTETAQLLGQFDKYADVDVFAIKLIKRKKTIFFPQINTQPSISSKTVGDLFNVCVGTVVDNRDPHSGSNFKYIISKGLKGWTLQKDFPLSRKHGGKSFNSPFIVIKRTSRMGDTQRAVATIINIKDPVFVDNHLIILKPKSGKLRDCQHLLSTLKNKKTDNWLNEQIRCRHLTTKIVSKIPIWQ